MAQLHGADYDPSTSEVSLDVGRSSSSGVEMECVTGQFEVSVGSGMSNTNTTARVFEPDYFIVGIILLPLFDLAIDSILSPGFLLV